MHQCQTGNDRTAEEKVDPLDDQWRAVLQFERGAGGGMKFQYAVAAECARPADLGPVIADNCPPTGLEAGQNPAPAGRDDRRCKLRDGDADRAHALPALGLDRRTS